MTHSPHMPSGWVSQLNSWCWLVLSRGVWVSMQSQFPHSLCLPHLSSLRLLESQFDPPALLSRTINSVQFSQLDFFPPLVLSLNTSARAGGGGPKRTSQFKLSTALSWVHFVLNVQFVLSTLRSFQSPVLLLEEPRNPAHHA